MKIENKITIRILIFIVIGIAAIIIMTFNTDDNTNNEVIDEKPSVTFFLEDGNTATFYVEIADTYDERAKGLMDRENLAEDSGMLFINEEPRNVCYWMKNCLIPLDMIFIDEKYNVVNVEEAVVEHNVSDDDLIRYCSDEPVLYIVEINYGLSKNYSIAPGVKVELENI